MTNLGAADKASSIGGMKDQEPDENENTLAIYELDLQRRALKQKVSDIKEEQRRK